MNQIEIINKNNQNLIFIKIPLNHHGYGLSGDRDGKTFLFFELSFPNAPKKVTIGEGKCKILDCYWKEKLLPIEWKEIFPVDAEFEFNKILHSLYFEADKHCVI